MNRIGIDQKSADKLTTELSDLLSNYQVFYTNVRGFHWNIKGKKFFELHLKFEELYNDLQLKIDEIAERILTLGGSPQHEFSKYLVESEIQEATAVSNADETVKSVLNSLQLLLQKQRNLLRMSGDVGDEGTNALMSDYIREQEKLTWMYDAFMSK